MYGVKNVVGHFIMKDPLMNVNTLMNRPSSLALELKEHVSPYYPPRTYHNAYTADLTIAFAVDYTTAGERLTERAAKGKYLQLPLYLSPQARVHRLKQYMDEHPGIRTINIAGNGIYTLKEHRIDQPTINRILYDTLKTPPHPVHILSGGQTGVDEAGAVAGAVLGWDVTVTFPKGFKRRISDSEGDIDSTYPQIREHYETSIKELHHIVDTPMNQYIKSKCVVFAKTAYQWGEFSNFHSKFPVKIPGTDIKLYTSEHLYQILKHPRHPDVQWQIYKNYNTYVIKKLARETPFHPEDVPWDELKEYVMYQVVLMKLQSHEDIFKALFRATKGRDIVEYSTRDRYWGAGPVDDDPTILQGDNQLGKTWMWLRDNPPTGCFPSSQEVRTEVARRLKLFIKMVETRERTLL